MTEREQAVDQAIAEDADNLDLPEGYVARPAEPGVSAVYKVSAEKSMEIAIRRTQEALETRRAQIAGLEGALDAADGHLRRCVSEKLNLKDEVDDLEAHVEIQRKQLVIAAVTILALGAAFAWSLIHVLS